MNRGLALAGLVLIGLVGLVYLPGLGGGFAFDDYHTIVDNPSLDIQTLSWDALLDAAMSGVGIGPLARPLAMLSFAANRSVAGLRPEAYKLTNLAIHALNALLIFGLLRSWLPRLAPRAPTACAWLIAALWALHPINLTAVLYVVQRMTSLSATFVLLALALYTGARLRQLRGVPIPTLWSLAVALCVVLALLCKETALVLPLYGLLIEVCVLRPRRVPLTTRARTALGCAAVTMVVGGVWYFLHSIAPGYGGREFTLGERLWTEARVICAYLRLLIVPAPGAYALFHDDLLLSRGWLAPISTLLSVLGLLAVSALVVTRRARQPYLAFGWAWFLVGHLLEGSFVPLELMHEHRNYLPGLGILTLLVLALADALASRPAARRLCAALALAILGTVTALRASLWADPVLQIETDLAHHPRSPRLWYEAGRLRVEGAGSDPARLRAGVAALERAADLAPIKSLPLTALLTVAIERGDGAAVARLIATIAAEPRESVGIDVFQALVICQGYGKCRKDTATVQALSDALLARKDVSTASRQRLLEWLAVFYARILADPTVAMTILRDLVAARPADLGLRARLAEACASAGERREAWRLAHEVRAALPWTSVFNQRPLRTRLTSVLADEHGS